MRLIADYSEIDETCCTALTVQDNLLPVALPEGETPYAGTYAVTRSLGKTVFTGDQYCDFNTALSVLPRSENEDKGLSATPQWDLDRFTLTSITGYREFESHDRIGVDELATLITNRSTEQSAWSQELRISNEGPELSYVAGLYYFSQDLDILTTTAFGEDINDFFVHGFVYYPDSNNQFPLEDVPSFPLPSLPLFALDSGVKNDVQQEHEAVAVFGQVDYNLSSSLTLTAGLRYTYEEKDPDGVFTEASAPISPMAVLWQYPRYWRCSTPLRHRIPSRNPWMTTS